MKLSPSVLRLDQIAVCLMLSVLVQVDCFSQQLGNAPGDVNDPGAGVYSIPYGILKPESVERDIRKVFDRIEANTSDRIVDRDTGDLITDLSEPNPKAVADEGPDHEFRLWSYPIGVIYNAMMYATEATGDARYRDYVVKRLRTYFEVFPYFKRQGELYGWRGNPADSLVNTASLDDCGSMGAAIIKGLMSDSNAQYRWAIDSIAEYITHKQFRYEGILARQRPQKVSIWGDDMYMCVPFLAQMGHLTGETKYYDDAVAQVLGMVNVLYKERTGLLDHGWHAADGDYDTVFHWGRANGWCIMAMVELLNVLPKDHSGYAEVLHVYRRHCQNLIGYQGPDGLWRNLLDKTDSFSETTCTSMFVFGIARGINEGWLPPSWGMAAVAGWEGLSTMITEEGHVAGGCWGTTLANDAVYYYSRPTSVNNSHSYGPVMMAGAEVIRLLNNPRLESPWQHRTLHFREPFDGPLE